MAQVCTLPDKTAWRNLGLLPNPRTSQDKLRLEGQERVEGERRKGKRKRERVMWPLSFSFSFFLSASLSLSSFSLSYIFSPFSSLSRGLFPVFWQTLSCSFGWEKKSPSRDAALPLFSQASIAVLRIFFLSSSHSFAMSVNHPRKTLSCLFL